jgi:hypothetical protein
LRRDSFVSDSGDEALQDDASLQPDSNKTSSSDPIEEPEEGALPPVEELRALRWRMLFTLWWLVSIGAVVLIFGGVTVFEGGRLGGPADLRMEQWLGLGLLALHAWFGWKVWSSRGR